MSWHKTDRAALCNEAWRLVSSLRLVEHTLIATVRSEKPVTCPVLSHGLKRTLQPWGPPQLLEALGPPPAQEMWVLTRRYRWSKILFPVSSVTAYLMRQRSQSLSFPHTAQNLSCNLLWKKSRMEIPHMIGHYGKTICFKSRRWRDSFCFPLSSLESKFITIWSLVNDVTFIHAHKQRWKLFPAKCI